jgi:hypothetical protein
MSERDRRTEGGGRNEPLRQRGDEEGEWTAAQREAYREEWYRLQEHKARETRLAHEERQTPAQRYWQETEGRSVREQRQQREERDGRDERG